LRALREISSPPTVIVLTNFALPQFRDLALLLGANYFLDKALDIERLPTIVDSIATHQAQYLQKLEAPDTPNFRNPNWPHPQSSSRSATPRDSR
ncbi:MAG: hypothetical protein ACREF8_04540, partial [Chthoniobacterales bacterium]